MKLIQPFAALIQRGVSLTFNISAAGEQIQLNILPSGKDTKTGVALPPKALIGSAEELDQHLEEYLSKYAGAVTRIADVLATADVDLQAAEKEATDQARQALEEKRNKGTSKPGTKPTSSSAPKKRDLGAGLMDGDDEQEEEEHGDTAGTTLQTGGTETSLPASPAASASASAPADAAGLSSALF
jgi:PRTRC genetic system protein E